MTRRRAAAAAIFVVLAEGTLVVSACSTFGEDEPATTSPDASSADAAPEASVSETAATDGEAGADAEPFVLDCRKGQFCDDFDDAGRDLAPQGEWTILLDDPPLSLGVVPNVPKSPPRSLQVSHPELDAAAGPEGILGKQFDQNASGIRCTFAIYVQDLPAEQEQVFRVLSMGATAYWSLNQAAGKVASQVRFNGSGQDNTQQGPSLTFSSWHAVQVDLHYPSRSLSVTVDGMDGGALSWDAAVPPQTAAQEVRLGLAPLAISGSANAYFDDVKCAARP